VGTVVALTPSGTLTVRAPGATAAPEGTLVSDARGVVRGRVLRVFGPVAHPYLSVRLRRAPTPSEGAALIGAEVVRE
jgi:rRNA processing protein Gar1